MLAFLNTVSTKSIFVVAYVVHGAFSMLLMAYIIASDLCTLFWTMYGSGFDRCFYFLCTSCWFSLSRSYGATLGYVRL